MLDHDIFRKIFPVTLSKCFILQLNFEKPDSNIEEFMYDIKIKRKEILSEPINIDCKKF